jgi:hypothetical protein
MIGMNSILCQTSINTPFVPKYNSFWSFFLSTFIRMILNVDIHTNYIYRLIIYFEMEGVIKEGTTGAVASE